MPGRGNMSRPDVGLEPGQTIAILPSAVADGIAAGEVVDRPAAVVKELVENAIDAGAARIHVRIEAAGQELIEVVDDGHGMSPTDLPVAFRRHATSKLRSLEDLRTIHTLGFRGEALASIAAVTEVEAVSRSRDGGEGSRVKIRAGELLTTVSAGGPVGTRVTVGQWFFNTPARLKFLKQPATQKACRGPREPDRFPLAVLSVLVDPAEVDVNVPPTKREVRFRNERAVFATLERACYHALRLSPLYELQSTTGGPPLELRETAVFSAGSLSPHPRPPLQEGREIDEIEAPRLPPLTYIGQLLQGYLVAEAPDAAMLIDQHAAHERVLFDQILLRLDERRPASQLLLIPHLIDLAPIQLTAYQQHDAWLRTLGFEAEPFGPHTIRLLAAPSDMPEARADRVLELVLADLAGERMPDRRVRETAALIACHSAVRFGDALSPEAARQLLSSLALTAEPISCPHGRPTTLILPDDQLRRLFKRP